MVIWFLTFGLLCGITAAVLAIVAGADPVLALLAYSVGGTVGLLTSAAVYTFKADA